MSDGLPVEGTLARPLRMGFGERIVEVHFGSFAILEIDYPSDFDYGFSIDPTVTEKHYNVGEVITKKGVDPGPPIIAIRFNEPNPVLTGSALSGFTFKGIFAESHLLVHPAVTVVEAVERWRSEDQARIDANIAAFNAIQLAGYNLSLAAQPAAIEAFLTLHPEAEIFRNVTDLRGFVDPAPTGTVSFEYTPEPWFSAGGNSFYNPDGNRIFTFPAYETWHNVLGAFFPPWLSGIAWGKYPNYANQDRSRDSYVIDVSKLAGRTIGVQLFAQTSHINSNVDFTFITQTGELTAAAKRVVTPGNPSAVTTAKTASARSPVGTVIASFDRSGFIA